MFNDPSGLVGENRKPDDPRVQTSYVATLCPVNVPVTSGAPGQMSQVATGGGSSGGAATGQGSSGSVGTLSASPGTTLTGAAAQSAVAGLQANNPAANVNATPGGGGNPSPQVSRPLYKQDLTDKMKLQGECVNCSDNQIGEFFEESVYHSIRAKDPVYYLSEIRFTRNANKLGGSRNTVPDMTSDAIYMERGLLLIRKHKIPEGVAYEAKAMYGHLYMGEPSEQLRAHAVNLVAKLRSYMVRFPGFRPQLYLITTADVRLSKNLRDFLNSLVDFRHLHAHYDPFKGFKQMNFEPVDYPE
jgi:hypothetical protein